MSREPFSAVLMTLSVKKIIFLREGVDPLRDSAVKPPTPVSFGPGALWRKRIKLSPIVHLVASRFTVLIKNSICYPSLVPDERKRINFQ